MWNRFQSDIRKHVLMQFRAFESKEMERNMDVCVPCSQGVKHSFSFVILRPSAFRSSASARTCLTRSVRIIFGCGCLSFCVCVLQTHLSSPHCWLYISARNVCRDYLRQRWVVRGQNCPLFAHNNLNSMTYRSLPWLGCLFDNDSLAGK